MLRHDVLTYAQNREDIILAGFFDEGEVGFYVDVGAEAPTDLSVTKIFYDKGWRGINIEPIKRQYKLFVKDRPRDINLNIGISDKSSTLKFREYKGSGYSTFSEAMQEEHIADDEKLVKDFKDYFVEVRSLKQVLTEEKVKSIQFMKIDVEGLEYNVLKGNDWTIFRPEVICIEANHIQEDWRPFLKSKGYSFVFFDGLNNYYTDDNTNRASKFNYINAVIYREPIVNFRLLNDFKEYDNIIAWLESNNKMLQAELDQTRQQTQLLQTKLNEITPFRRHAKKFLKQHIANLDQRITSTITKNNKFTPVSVALTPQPRSLDKMLSAAKTADAKNHSDYNRPSRQILLPIYSRAKHGVRKTINLSKKTRRLRGEDQ